MELTPFWFGVYKLVKTLLYPYTWLVIILTALTVLLVLPPSPRRQRWCRGLALGGLAALLLLGAPVTAHTLAAWLEARAPAFDPATSRHFDAIVVLGAGAGGKGSLRPSDELTGTGMKRTRCGAELFRRGLAPKLLLAGGDAAIFGTGPKEAVEMTRLALELGVPETAILVEDRSRTTYENLVETKRLLGPASILLVTSAIHVPRAVALARKQGLETTPYACGYLAQDRAWDGLRRLDLFDLIPDVTALWVSTETITELAGTLVYRLSGKL